MNEIIWIRISKRKLGQREAVPGGVAAYAD